MVEARMEPAEESKTEGSSMGAATRDSNCAWVL